MDQRQIEKPIKKFLSSIPKHVKVEKVVLFGSFSKNKATTASDIDVFIVSNSFIKWDEDKRLDMLYKASRFIEPEIHPWGITLDEWQSANEFSLIGQARKKGKSINYDP
ncbi:hypothetical protein A3D03_00965 [Candidatus Gottesmanbacteria bacterium RIFCSPHIGHO2_02_FULL_40_13]|uniref:Polymerase nucleotidyl transferase domain-containing protein n=1 Tax=Candidatus Gottesmanbacteria bacterium RIFCSPHIGHO2_02_FULL_40_13 TaxID=1798384 RepID=A0A1F6A524_9BACT|nr:MAG: hypothetical protein A3D03_00965 [Candidatus Gottesmanbacteria bacterium RIFCSPHIGHO2_02_FULL_40_13]